jgi:hypothetical protein
MLCEAVKKDGRVCGSNALRDSTFCFMHDPRKAAEREAVRKLGGSRRGRWRGDVNRLPVKVRTAEDVMALLDYVKDELAGLYNSVPRTRAMIALASEYLHALDISEIETRLQALEELSHVKK